MIRRLLKYGCVCYAGLLLYIVFFARRRRGTDKQFREQINITPLKEKIQFLNRPDWSFGRSHYGFWEDAIGNIIMFIPMPFVLVMFLGGNIKWYWSLGFAFCSSVLIECLQYVFNVGRLDIDDVILNTFGAVVGIVLLSITRLIFKAK